METLRPNLRSDVQKHLLGVLHRRNNNIGNSVLYVSSPEGAVSALHDLDECQSPELNDCHASATCSNSWGSFQCACEAGLRDPWADQPQRAGRECQSCPDAYCNNRGSCSYNEEGTQSCACDSTHYGAQCEIDGEVLGVAIGASVAAVIIIVLTLVCLIMWSRRWQREQKNAMGSPVFGYMNTAPLKSAGLPQAGYQVTLEDRMRWAQIADVMAQTNHYGVSCSCSASTDSPNLLANPCLSPFSGGTHWTHAAFVGHVCLSESGCHWHGYHRWHVAPEHHADASQRQHGASSAIAQVSKHLPHDSLLPFLTLSTLHLEDLAWVRVRTACARWRTPAPARRRIAPISWVAIFRCHVQRVAAMAA